MDQRYDRCGEDFFVDFDQDRRAWAVDLRRDGHDHRTYVEPDDMDACMDGRSCFGLGVELSQLQDTADRRPVGGWMQSVQYAHKPCK